ncbi:X8 domain-containing protein [Cephalotus follicularis]|uniref:X8 domain-containing protein n=1 Tax=Cephalotus follicularis TaxID=3775 RepID=A0A1Q3CHI8_CEPFO|nr:X8 domain-containing protein [Cephalotus follicularis]
MGLLTFLVLYIIVVNHSSTVLVVCANWCVARSDASNQALQAALDYACGAGADCTPLQSNGLCFLPNTLQYAFNSYFQRKAMAPGSCDFSATATIAQTDPSYGSCVYPSSLRY